MKRGGNRRGLKPFRKRMTDFAGRRKNWRGKLNNHPNMYFARKSRAEDLIQVSRKSFLK